MDGMKQYTSWTMVLQDYKPLSLLDLIEKTVLAQTEDQYPFAIVYAQKFRYTDSIRTY